MPDLGTTWHLPQRAGRAAALGIALLGGRITAAEAVNFGLIWQVVDDAELDAVVASVAEQLKRSSPDAMVRIRRLIDDAANNTLTEQLDLEMLQQQVLIPRNMGEGAAAFLERREPIFDGKRTDRA